MRSQKTFRNFLKSIEGYEESKRERDAKYKKTGEGLALLHVHTQVP